MARKVLVVWVTLAFLLIAPAARPQDFSPPLGLTHRDGIASAASAGSVQPLTLTVPAETEVAVEMLSGIHTRVSHVDDLIQARLLEPVYVNGQVALPLGTLVDGRITSIRSARRLNRPAELLLRFERVTLPNGQAEPIRAELAAFDNPGPPKSRLDPEGHLKGTRAFSWKVFAGGFAVLGTLVTAKASFASSAALAPLAPAGGAALLTYAFVWPRGNDVHLPPQTRCRIRLNLPLTVRVQW